MAAMGPTIPEPNFSAFTGLPPPTSESSRSDTSSQSASQLQTSSLTSSSSESTSTDASSITASGSSGSESAGSAGSTTASGSGSESAASAGASNSRRINIGIIVGAAIGGLTLVVVIGLLLYWRRKKRHGDSFISSRKRRTNLNEGEEEVDETAKPAPHDLKNVSEALPAHTGVHVNQSSTSLSVKHPSPTELYGSYVNSLVQSPEHPFRSSEKNLITLAPSSESRTPFTEAIQTNDHSLITQDSRSLIFSSSSSSFPASLPPTQIPYNNDSSTKSTSSTTKLTTRQLSIRNQADELRQQLHAIQQAQATTQQAMISSNDEMRNTLAAMMAHIQRLDRQIDSSSVRGSMDELPPEYDARRK
ncbi:hypothetical protein VKT23_018161 [Stygiomarasmius scandens]|uniref:Mid2 domain-containing protein n=1 Tax=Marasmiellus scandens TaxID=2682957 RepID=A0ABR1IQ21_9AGAR